MGRLTALVLAVLALGCAGVAWASSGQPQKQHTPADMARAKSVVLRPADFGVGWKSKPSTSGGGTPRCKNFEPDESDLVETGTADSPEFDKGLRYVSSSAALFKTAGQAQASWDRIVKPGLLTCLGSIFSGSATKNGVTTKVAGKETLTSFPKLATRTAAYRIRFTATSQGVTFHGSVDLILLGKGRIDFVMISVAFGAPPAADELRLAKLVASRF